MRVMQAKEEAQRGPCLANLKSHIKTPEVDARILANRYKVLKKLGSGSHGTVYLVSDLLHSEELCVVKEIYIGDLQPDETVGAVNEARLLCKLSHPGIVKFHNSFIDGDFFCIVTEYCEGGDLDVVLKACRKASKELNRKLLLSWFIQLLHAIRYMHQRSVLHRDIKSKNVFLKNNKIKVGDFGISRILLGTCDKATTFTGTPYYMAPEVLTQEGYNSKSDIWSLGVILYQMCSLKHAFDGKSLPEVIFNITQGDIPSIPQRYGKELEDIYGSMLCRDPLKRPSAADILNNQFINSQIEILKIDADHNENEVKHQTDEIVQMLCLPKKKNAVDKSNHLTARDQLKHRKLLKGELEAEKLKQVTASLYEESRKKYFSLKQRQSVVGVPFIGNENGDEDEDELLDDDKTIVNNHLMTKEHSEKTEYVNCFGESTDNTVVYIQQNNSISEAGDAKTDLKTVTRNKEMCQSILAGNNSPHGHCFGESIDDTILNRPAKKLQYTHCFGEDDDTGTGSSIESICTNEVSETSDCIENVTASTIVPDDASVADTFYSFNEFEDDSGNSDSFELDAVVQCLENALNVDTLNEDTESSTSVVSHVVDPEDRIRQEKIDSLRNECIKVLGMEGFSRVYKFLNKARFQSETCLSESAIMKRLRKLVSNPRDCFLVDQLLFLEKQK